DAKQFHLRKRAYRRTGPCFRGHAYRSQAYRQCSAQYRAFQFLRIWRHQCNAGVPALSGLRERDNMEGLMQGKRGLIMGVANNHSLAWGISKQLAAQGAELAFTYQGDALGKRVKPLAEQVGSDFVLPCDVEDIASVDAVFAEIEKKWGKLDFIVHAIGFSDKNELKGRYADVTTRENFSRTMVISAYSFTEMAQRAEKLMKDGGSILTLTYGGS